MLGVQPFPWGLQNQTTTKPVTLTNQLPSAFPTNFRSVTDRGEQAGFPPIQLGIKEGKRKKLKLKRKKKGRISQHLPNLK
jgi:hypothetical protein